MAYRNGTGQREHSGFFGNAFSDDMAKINLAAYFSDMVLII
jgi:hypothetical protein